ncbi:MAG: hypothetical protein QOD99_1293 [Chthoniobacter sp.]|nr:hypothetical protein [Chthoniobacter sp.]
MGSFSKAAEANRVTQSAVSQQIRALEKRFAVTLVERTPRTFALTVEGEAFLAAAREIYEIYDHLGDRLRELQNIVAGEIKVAVIYSIGLHELPPFVKEFRALHPDVEVRVEYRRSWEIYDLVLSGEMDIGLVSYPARRPGIACEPFLKDRLVMICHPSHRLARRKRIELCEIDGEKFIAFEPDQPTRKVLDKQFRTLGMTVAHAIEFDNVETVKRAVEIENGISIVPEKTVQQEVQNGALVAIEIEKPEMWRPLGILTKRNSRRSPAVKEFVELLKNGLPDSADCSSRRLSAPA